MFLLLLLSNLFAFRMNDVIYVFSILADFQHPLQKYTGYNSPVSYLPALWIFILDTLKHSKWL